MIIRDKNVISKLSSIKLQIREIIPLFCKNVNARHCMVIQEMKNKGGEKGLYTSILSHKGRHGCLKRKVKLLLYEKRKTAQKVKSRRTNLYSQH